MSASTAAAVIRLWRSAIRRRRKSQPGRTADTSLVGERLGGMHNVGDTLFVASNVKAVKLNKDMSRYAGEKFPAPGTSAEAQMWVMQTGMAAPLKVYSHGSGDFSVTDKEKTAAHLTYNETLKQLVVRHGLLYKTASALIKEAEKERGVRVLIQYPAGHPLEKKADDPFLGPGPSAPSMPEPPMQSDPMLGGVQSQQPMTAYQEVPEMHAQSGNKALYDPNPQLDTNPYNLAMDAAGTGQKDVFDAGVVGSLLKVVDSDSLVDKYLGDMFLGLDRIGRVLFLYYQHSDAFRQRYGEEDMQELEDSLKNTFKGTGDLVLFLKQKTVEENPEGQKTEIDLTPTAT
jgi:hypothetical protein